MNRLMSCRLARIERRSPALPARGPVIRTIVDPVEENGRVVPREVDTFRATAHDGREWRRGPDESREAFKARVIAEVLPSRRGPLGRVIFWPAEA